MSEKKVITFPAIENANFYFGGEKIIIIPFFTITDKVVLINEYVESLYGEDTSDLATRYLVAEYILALHIIDKQTNINIDDLNADNVFNSGLWEQVILRIHNYEDFRKNLNRVLELYQSQENLNKSIGSVLDKVSIKVMEVLDKISNSDLNVEGLQKVSTELVEKLEELNKTVPGITATKNVAKRKKKVETEIIQ